MSRIDRISTAGAFWCAAIVAVSSSTSRALDARAIRRVHGLEVAGAHVFAVGARAVAHNASHASVFDTSTLESDGVERFDLQIPDAPWTESVLQDLAVSGHSGGLVWGRGGMGKWLLVENEQPDTVPDPNPDPPKAFYDYVERIANPFAMKKIPWASELATVYLRWSDSDAHAPYGVPELHRDRAIAVVAVNFSNKTSLRILDRSQHLDPLPDGDDGLPFPRSNVGTFISAPGRSAIAMAGLSAADETGDFTLARLHRSEIRPGKQLTALLLYSPHSSFLSRRGRRALVRALRMGWFQLKEMSNQLLFWAVRGG